MGTPDQQTSAAKRSLDFELGRFEPQRDAKYLAPRVTSEGHLGRPILAL